MTYKCLYLYLRLVFAGVVRPDTGNLVGFGLARLVSSSGHGVPSFFPIPSQQR
jgi:hypothetical protein